MTRRFVRDHEALREPKNQSFDTEGFISQLGIDRSELDRLVLLSQQADLNRLHEKQGRFLPIGKEISIRVSGRPSRCRLLQKATWEGYLMQVDPVSGIRRKAVTKTVVNVNRWSGECYWYVAEIPRTKHQEGWIAENLETGRIIHIPFGTKILEVY